MRGKNFLIVALIIIILILLPYIFLYFGWTSQKKYEEVEEKEIVINDMDGDGLTDEEEKKFGTNPQQVDSDRDLLKDGEEVAYWNKRMSEAKEYVPNGDIDKDGKKNILDFDSDNDGLSDGYEVKNAYDPANPNEPIKKGKTHDYSISKYNITNFDNFYMNETNEILFYIQPISAPRYWKLATYAKYDGRTWYEEGEQKNRYYEEKIKFDEVQLPSISQTYTVKINGTWLRHIPTSAYTYKVFNFEPKNATIMYSTKTKDDFFAITPVSSYKFSAHLFKYNYSEIANAVIPFGMYEYIALPSLSPRISELAKNITKNYSMPYEKIQAISRYLASNYQYNINRIIPASYDPLDWFLFVGKEGICTDFATAFVILCRANNIPSRFVAGFKPGIVINDMRIVYKGHAHSWIEVLFNKFGWVGFDVVSNSVGNGTGFGNYGSDNNIIVSYPNATKIGSSGGTGGYNISYGDTDGDGIQNEIDDDDDNDCLLDIDEINYTTSPYEKDSDFDGIDDFYEINNSSTSPINPDTDGDGLSDYYEIYISHTDPNKFDTDDGGATDWYEVNYNTSPFDSSDDYLLGDMDGDGLIDKEEALYGTDQNKFDTDGDGMNDYDELKLGTNPNKADSDGDGINDYDELKLDTDPSKPDSDGDGINDYDEVRGITDPNCQDTDGDGLSDSEERNFGSDPNKADSDSDGLRDDLEKQYGTDPKNKDTDNDKIPDNIDENKLEPNKPPPPPPKIELGELAKYITLIGLIALAAVGIGYFVWRKKHLSDIKNFLERAEKQLDLLDEIENADEIRKVIFETYRQFCKTLTKYGFVRHEALTAREFETAIREAIRIDKKNLKELTDLFEEARYSAHSLSPGCKDRAKECFRGIKASLEQIDRRKNL